MPRRLTRKYIIVTTLIVGGAGLLSGELIARFVLELGDPVLMQAHPAIEYLAQPDQEAHIYGNRHLINTFGMRSDNPPSPEVGAIRVLVIGDSVINGGRRTDHANLATTLAQQMLAEQLERLAWVGNASAGSWGPGNWRAYVETFGTFDADAAVLVLSPHDIGDTPQFLDRTTDKLTTRKPISALAAAVAMVAERVASRLGSDPPPNPNDLNQPSIPIPPANAPQRIAAEHDLATLLTRLRQDAIPTAVLYFPEADADDRHADVQQRLRNIVEHAGSIFIDLSDTLLTDQPFTNPAYRDRMHPSQHGQRLLAQAIRDVVLEMLDVPAATSAPQP